MMFKPWTKELQPFYVKKGKHVDRANKFDG